MSDAAKGSEKASEMFGDPREGGSAFPTEWKEHGITFSQGGLTKRELFAAMAMQGLLAAVYSSKEMLNEFTTDRTSGYAKHITGCKAVTGNAVDYADALIAELAKGKA